ncbi:MAG: caspase family protein [Myxococcota bacterium]
MTLGSVVRAAYVVRARSSAQTTSGNFFDPGLLAKALGATSAPLRRVPRLARVTPPPRATVTGPDPAGRATVAFEDRGGGVGTVFATLNDSDVSAWFASACGSFDAPCTVDLSDLPTWTKGLDNRLRIAVSNQEGSVRSRGLVRTVTASGRPPGDAPDLWVLAVGTSDYAGSGLDLRYPALDASRFALAMRLAGRAGFGPNRTHVRVLATSELANVVGPPRRDTLEAAFEWLGQSDANDTVLVFMAGHGVAMTDPDQGVDDYFYLLPSTGSVSDLAKPDLRKLRAWSGDDLADALARVPTRKRVVVLDTCAAGKLDQSLTLERTLSSDAIRAHVRARHRTGAWVLAGSAADQVSYEATRFGQRLLTYALLEGMQGPALDEGNQLWVSRWFAHAEAAVPQHARDIGGVQRPVLRRGAGDFPLGEVPAERRPEIGVSSPKPVVVRSVVVAEGGRPDRLGVARAVDRALRARVDAGARFVMWDVDRAPGGAQLSGTYTPSGRRITFAGVVSRGDDELAVSAESDTVDALGNTLADQVVAWLTASGP